MALYYDVKIMTYLSRLVMHVNFLRVSAVLAGPLVPLDLLKGSTLMPQEI